MQLVHEQTDGLETSMFIELQALHRELLTVLQQTHIINSALALLRVISRFAGGSLNEWGTGSVHVTSPLPPRHETIVAIIQDRVTAVG